MYSFILLILLASSSASSLLTCGSNISCPDSVVTCRCSEAMHSLVWQTLDCRIVYPNPTRPVGVVVSFCHGQHSVVLNSEDINSDMISSYSSTLNITLRENLTVTCGDASGLSESVMLTTASKLETFKTKPHC